MSFNNILCESPYLSDETLFKQLAQKFVNLKYFIICDHVYNISENGVTLEILKHLKTIIDYIKQK